MACLSIPLVGRKLPFTLVLASLVPSPREVWGSWSSRAFWSAATSHVGDAGPANRSLEGLSRLEGLLVPRGFSVLAPGARLGWLCWDSKCCMRGDCLWDAAAHPLLAEKLSPPCSWCPARLSREGGSRPQLQPRLPSAGPLGPGASSRGPPSSSKPGRGPCAHSSAGPPFGTSSRLGPPLPCPHLPDTRRAVHLL